MEVLVVGGTGMIGVHTALHLRDRGDNVTVAARGTVDADSPVAGLPVLRGDYTRQTFTRQDLAPFDAIVFAAGQDVRHLPRDADEATFWKETQSAGVPAFAALAKSAGVSRFVQVGSYYHHLRPDLADSSAYVAARRDADEGARALADDSFTVCTLNPPSIIGAIPGVTAKRYRRMVSWAAGNEPQIPDHAPAGGTNYMSARSLAEAIGGALDRGAAGAAYLVGDANLTFTQFFQLLVDAAGGNRTIAERDEPHPFMPDSMIVQGRGNVLAYEPDPAETALLGYTRGDCERAVAELVQVVRAATARAA
ncbi:NAD-dependent epimerase/dehydratase family protein [Micromonospora chalcea]|uniref:NAD-dependent epimerase/dehydratase family protein n=1 Tax=Micromonospora chalcea TaxID=1874 RepID=UPI000CE3D04E|nr:NAD(P)-dependent oxidoreductase [Micromonospora chalcea]PPA60479.1 nucleoside-diphosphate sugar epimerase [Micromonospora chalcea]